MKAFAMRKNLREVGWIEKDYPTCVFTRMLLSVHSLLLHVHPCAYSMGRWRWRTFWYGLRPRSLWWDCWSCDLVKDFKVGDKILCNAITPDWSSVSCTARFCDALRWSIGWLEILQIIKTVFSEYSSTTPTVTSLICCRDDLWRSCYVCDRRFQQGHMPANLRMFNLARYGCRYRTGPVGLMAVAGAVIKRCRTLDRSRFTPWRLWASKGYGATDIVDHNDCSNDRSDYGINARSSMRPRFDRRWKQPYLKQSRWNPQTRWRRR